MDNLLVLTTAGTLGWLKKAISTLRDNLDVLVVDDATPGNKIRNFCLQKGLAFISKTKPKGLTDSWNRAYKFFRENKYKGCILSNDDVRFSEGFSQGLLDGVDKFTVVGPVSNEPSRYRNFQKSQWLFRYTDLPYENIDNIQRFLEKKYKGSPYIEAVDFNGFCFAFSRGISRYMFSDTELFNPKCVNVGNEVWLVRRIKERGGTIAICRTSYVLHRKGVTLRNCGRDRNQLWRKIE